MLMAFYWTLLTIYVCARICKIWSIRHAERTPDFIIHWSSDYPTSPLMTVYQLLRLRCNVKTGKRAFGKNKDAMTKEMGTWRRTFFKKFPLLKPKGNHGRFPTTQPQDTITKKELWIFTLTFIVAGQTKNWTQKINRC